jgi:c(7)-type cytochrome triheme protein
MNRSAAAEHHGVELPRSRVVPSLYIPDPHRRRLEGWFFRSLPQTQIMPSDISAVEWYIPDEPLRMPRPQEFGNVVINDYSEKNDMAPVGFKHGIHRASYTCRACHFELNFAMTLHGTKIKEEKNRAGEYCGACHNGSTAFGHRDENCRCSRSGNIGQTDHVFIEVKDFPKALSGD